MKSKGYQRNNELFFLLGAFTVIASVSWQIETGDCSFLSTSLFLSFYIKNYSDKYGVKDGDILMSDTLRDTMEPTLNIFSSQHTRYYTHLNIAACERSLLINSRVQ